MKVTEHLTRKQAQQFWISWWAWSANVTRERAAGPYTYTGSTDK